MSSLRICLALQVFMNTLFAKLSVFKWVGAIAEGKLVNLTFPIG